LIVNFYIGRSLFDLLYFLAGLGMIWCLFQVLFNFACESGDRFGFDDGVFVGFGGEFDRGKGSQLGNFVPTPTMDW
jgi:hypothetical protein